MKSLMRFLMLLYIALTLLALLLVRLCAPLPDGFCLRPGPEYPPIVPTPNR